ncbi:hypothetical protein B0H14DRAFT_2488176 [Mycena olivaceomarginata]|nr:hypothetical protein B0H14DRAFT_2488176 [Mycena olivaceomarginata]
MSTATDEVISTPELVEQILAHLPMRDLLVVAPLVSKTWRATTLSPTLQRALFFEADPTTEPVQNPLLAELFPPFFAPDVDEGTYSFRSWPGHTTSFMAMPWAKAPEAFNRAGASWRRMLVTQPPAQTMVVTHVSHNRGGNSERRAVVRDPSLRMGVLYDIAMPFVDRDALFCIRWHHGVDREADLILKLRSMVMCIRTLERGLDERFDCEEKAQVEIEFGEWVHLGYD